MSITSTVVQRADTRFIEAAEALRPYVGCFWVITAEQGALIGSFPTGPHPFPSSRETAVRPRGFSGPLIDPDVRRFRSPGLLIGVRLRPGVAFLVSGLAADAMVGRRIRLSGAAFRALAVDARCSRAPEQHIDALQRVLLERLAGVQVHDVVSRAVQTIERSEGCVRVADLAATCGVSPRQLNRLMRRWVGYGAKRLARIVRFQSTLKQIEQAPRQSGAALASDNGYFDQAHLTSDTARLAGRRRGIWHRARPIFTRPAATPVSRIDREHDRPGAA